MNAVLGIDWKKWGEWVFLPVECIPNISYQSRNYSLVWYTAPLVDIYCTEFSCSI